ncbi:hypothetical protein D3C72_1011660 [compost metagenome]
MSGTQTSCIHLVVAGVVRTTATADFGCSGRRTGTAATAVAATAATASVIPGVGTTASTETAPSAGCSRGCTAHTTVQEGISAWITDCSTSIAGEATAATGIVDTAAAAAIGTTCAVTTAGTYITCGTGRCVGCRDQGCITIGSATATGNDHGYVATCFDNERTAAAAKLLCAAGYAASALLTNQDFELIRCNKVKLATHVGTPARVGPVAFCSVYFYFIETGDGHTPVLNTTSYGNHACLGSSSIGCGYLGLGGAIGTGCAGISKGVRLGKALCDAHHGGQKSQLYFRSKLHHNDRI